MASNRHATPQINYMFICILVSLLFPTIHEGTAKVYDSSRSYLNDDGGRRLTREYNLRQGALRGLIVKPSRLYDLQSVEMFLGIPYAAPPIGSLRFMPPVNAPPWSGLKNATEFAPVCPQSLPSIKKDNPPSLGRQHYMSRLKPFLKKESEDCLYLNIYVPYREQKPKKFPVLVFVHGDSFEWSSGNPYDGRILSSYGNIMVITLNFRLGILGFMKPSVTEHEYGNNGLLDQLAALQWIKDNIEDLNGDPRSVTLMGHGTGAACINFLMLSPISNGLFHRAILMSGSALSDWAMTKDPTQYTLQVAQSLGCNPNLKNMMKCMQNKPLSEIKKVQILAREFESPLAPVVAGSFIPNEPSKTMASFPSLLSKYQLLSGVTELESYHDFSVIELDHGILETQRDDFINKLSKILFGGAEDVALKEILKQYSPVKLDPQRWNVETNRDVILSLFSDARTLAPVVRFAKYHSQANRQSYFYVFGHNSISTEYAPLNKSVNGEELPYALGIPLGSTFSHFHSEYTQNEKLLSEVVMRLWTNFVKIGTPNTQKVNKYYTFDEKQWSHYNVEWPEYNVDHQSYLKLDIPPFISSLYRSNFSKFWIESLPSKMSKYIIDPLFEYAPSPTTQKYKLTHRELDSVRKIWAPRVVEPPRYISSPSYGKVKPYSPPISKSDTDHLYREIQSISSPARPHPPELLEKTILRTATTKQKSSPNYSTVSKTSSATITLIICLSMLFVIMNIGICVGLYVKRRKSHLRNNFHENSHSRAEIGDVDLIGQKTKEDKSALQTFKNGCSAIKSISINKVRGGSIKNIKKKIEPCKTPKSDDSGGFRERFQLRRHLSTSTLDAHTKVRDWIANEVMHRCSPNILRKSNLDLNSDKKIDVGKIYTRSEEILTNSKVKTDIVTPNSSSLSSQKKYSSDRKRNSEKTASTSALGSHSSIGSNKHYSNKIQSKKSSDSLKSKGTDSTKSKKVSVAIDATPAARTNSILKQEPIELSKSLDYSECQHSKSEFTLKRSKTEGNFDQTDSKSKNDTMDKQIFTNVVTMSLKQDQNPLRIVHKHSTSDPVTDVNYDKIMKEKIENAIEDTDILPPVTFRNDINVTSLDEKGQSQPLSSAEALLTIKRRNFPKVLPDFPKAQKRFSLQPSSLHTFKSFSGLCENSERSKVPPQPPPRTTTLERRLNYANSKPLSSFDVPRQNKLPNDSFSRNYENMDSLTRYSVSNNSFEGSSKHLVKSDTAEMSPVKERECPRVIIASSDIPSSTNTKILIKPSSSQTELISNIPRVRLPDDFHSQTSGSITSVSSIYWDDDTNDVEDYDDIAEDKLLQELVGGVESPTNLDIIFDSKGPETVYEKKLEIVPVKVNPGLFHPKSSEDYVCISNLLLPDTSGLEKTAQIKPNIGINKLQEKSESIHRPREKAVKLKQKKGISPGHILSITSKNRKNKLSFDSCDMSKLEHSNSGSSNDTETSTGTVKKVEIR